MLTAMAATVGLVIATIAMFYEVLRLTSNHLSDLPIPPRARIIVVVLASFAGHTAAVWTYAAAYWIFAVHWDMPSFSGVPVEGFLDCLYFSVVTYTSLGFGDHVPVGHARLIAGVEALNGLMLIGWSASFTYLAMERYWPMHPLPRRRREPEGQRARKKPDSGGHDPPRERQPRNPGPSGGQARDCADRLSLALASVGAATAVDRRSPEYRTRASEFPGPDEASHAGEPVRRQPEPSSQARPLENGELSNSSSRCCGSR